MTAGLPGTGIGGVFYLLSALFMPFAEIVATLRGRSSWLRWWLVLRQLTMATGVLGGMWFIGVLAGLAFRNFAALHPISTAAASTVHGRHSVLHTHFMQSAMHVNIFHVAPVLMSIATLMAILTLTNLMRLFFRPVAEEA